MARNKLTLTVLVRDDGYLPPRERVVAWLADRYDEAVEVAGQQKDGTPVRMTAEMPCPEIPRE